MCPAGTEVLAAEDLPAKGGDAPITLPALRVLPLGRRGAAPVAYQFRWAGKAVLVSGRIPRKPSVPSSQEMARALNGPDGDVRAYLRSLSLLGKESPEMWPPAVPVHGQNANLYD